MKRTPVALLVTSLGVVAIIGGYAGVQALGARRLERRLGVSALTPFFGERIRRGMLSDEVVAAVPKPDRTEYFRRHDGVLAQRLVYAIPFARDYHVTVLYADSTVTSVEFEDDYLGPLRAISTQEATKQLKPTGDGMITPPR